MYRFDFHAGQIQGGHKRQEDRYAFRAAGDHLLAVLADGAASHPCGDRAAQLAIDTVVARVRQTLARDPDAPIAPLLEQAACAADAALFEDTARVPDCAGMVSTLIAVCVHPASDRLYYVYVGDSLLLRLTPARIEEVCTPHTDGLAITSALGLRLDELCCPPEGIPIRPGDRFLLASDGIETLPHALIAGILERSTDARCAVEDLLRAVVSAGQPHQDNTTAMALFVGGEAA